MATFGPTPVIHGNEIQQNGIGNQFLYNPQIWEVVGDGCGRQEPFDRDLQFSKNTYNPELELLIARLNFIVRYWDPSRPNPVAICVHSGNNKHIYTLAKLFPMITFDVYNEESPNNPIVLNVKINKSKFDIVDTLKYSGKNILFMYNFTPSLTYDETEESDRQNNTVLEREMKKQRDLYEVLKPVIALLRFEPIRYSLDIEESVSFSYMDGDIYFTSYSDELHYHTYLIPNSSLPIRTWKMKEYQEMVFYHQNVVRPKLNFVNPLNNKNENIDLSLNFKNGFDESSFAFSVRQYFQKFNVNVVDEQMKMVLKDLYQNI